jgi:hypothetical protein
MPVITIEKLLIAHINALRHEYSLAHENREDDLAARLSEECTELHRRLARIKGRRGPRRSQTMRVVPYKRRIELLLVNGSPPGRVVIVEVAARSFKTRRARKWKASL